MKILQPLDSFWLPFSVALPALQLALSIREQNCNLEIENCLSGIWHGETQHFRRHLSKLRNSYLVEGKPSLSTAAIQREPQDHPDIKDGSCNEKSEMREPYGGLKPLKWQTYNLWKKKKWFPECMLYLQVPNCRVLVEIGFCPGGDNVSQATCVPLRRGKKEVLHRAALVGKENIKFNFSSLARVSPALQRAGKVATHQNSGSTNVQKYGITTQNI